MMNIDLEISRRINYLHEIFMKHRDEIKPNSLSEEVILMYKFFLNRLASLEIILEKMIDNLKNPNIMKEMHHNDANDK